MKRKKIGLSLAVKLVSVLVCVSILSIGFASWWIVQMPGAQTESGSFTVYEVKDKAITIENMKIENSTIVFGKPKANDIKPVKWLVAGTEVAEENLTATLKFTVKVNDGELNTFLDKIKITFTPNADSKSTFDAAIASTNGTSTIGNPKLSGKYTVGSTDTTIDEQTYTGTALTLEFDAPAASSVDVELNITFNWNSNGNPYNYYNEKTYTADLADEARELLTAISGLSACKYDLTVETTPKA